MSKMKDLLIEAIDEVLNDIEMDIEYVFDFESIGKCYYNVDEIILDYDNDSRIAEYINNVLVKIFDSVDEELFTMVYNGIIEDLRILVINKCEDLEIEYVEL